MRQANYKQQAMYTIQQSKKVSVKTCVVKIRHTKQKKKKKKSVPVDSLRVDTPAMRAADYKLQTLQTKKHSEEHWCKSNVSEAGEGTAPSNEEWHKVTRLCGPKICKHLV
jgi:hypothetical protein